VLGSKPRMILQLKRDSLLAYTVKDEQAKLDFPPAVVRSMEVLDHNKLVELVDGFADQYGLRGRKLPLVLDDGLVFQKVIQLADNADLTALQNEFEEKIPLAPEDRQVMSLKLKSQLVLLATNRALYGYVLHALASRNVKVTAVVPMALFAKGITRLTPEIAERVLHNHHLATVANFLTADRR
jgi:hypothetical protein